LLRRRQDPHLASEGIIIVDTIFPYNSEELISGGLQNSVSTRGDEAPAPLSGLRQQ